ncbi:MAG TPA: hypothetical protein VLK65_27820 [Vicinamibacteria bacterium]|nr:hypothetical protein [Vicinamibacteria bacterium]
MSPLASRRRAIGEALVTWQDAVATKLTRRRRWLSRDFAIPKARRVIGESPTRLLRDDVI